MKVYLSKEQYKELLKNGSITVGETTILFNEEDDYITPIEEIDTSKFVTTNTQQTITAVKNISCASGATITLGFNGCIDITDPSGSTGLYSTSIQQIGSSGYINFSYDYGLQYFNMLEGINSTLKFPANKNGTIATTDDCKKYYLHKIQVADKNDKYVYFSFRSSKETMYTLEELVALSGSGKLGYCTGTYDGKIITINSVLDMNGTYYFSGYDSQTSKIISVDSSTFKDAVYDT